MPLKKDRVIIDTNLWISFLLSKNLDKLGYLISNNLITLIFSESILDEFINVATRPKFKKYFSSEDLNNL